MTRALNAETLVADLARIVGPDRVSVREIDLDTYSRDMWPRLLLAVADGAPLPYRPHAVVWPTKPSEVAAIVRYAATEHIPIIPYGGGSGVCGGAVPVQGGITIDLKRIKKLRDISREDMVCDVDAGINGERLERALAARGYTLGHFPSSIYCSTLGGWLACRAAGQMSTKYGKIEDRVAGLTVVTGRGEIIKTDELARATRGPNWTQLIVGSEGTLGIILSARMRVSVAPALRLFRGYEFADVADGVEAIRRVMQRGINPAVVRLYDEFDTFINNVGILKSSEDPSDVRAIALRQFLNRVVERFHRFPQRQPRHQRALHQSLDERFAIQARRSRSFAAKRSPQRSIDPSCSTRLPTASLSAFRDRVAE